MMRVFEITTGCLRRNAAAESGPLPESAIWIDLNAPTPDEVKRTEALLGIVAPTREEMQEIEASSRVYHEDGGHFMTTSVVSRTETDSPDSSAVTFVLANDRLLTLRYSEPMPFNTF
ncbi:MAG TPA: CorA family divalent cation transporter, partial [Micropepsaceae bacterium]|nr:CorA family divalent cation transporter [Micropepsaceae bacterium]